MNFLYPGFLFALLAIVIPILIHLFNFRKFKRVYFSNVQFLKEAKEEGTAKEKLKHRLLLASRILTVTFLVLAFAQPFVPSGDAAKKDLKGNVVSIYIDNSYSMESINQEGSLLDKAKRRAKEIAKGFGINDQFKLITNDFEGRHQRLVNQEEFIALLDDIKVSSSSKTLQQVVNRGAEGNSGNVNKVNYLISDFQQSFIGSKNIPATPDQNTTLIKLNANKLPNVAVDSVWFLSPLHKPNDAERLVVKLKNYAPQEAKDIPVNLTINNQQRSVSRLTIAANATVTDTLSFSGLKSGWQKAVLSIKDFPVTFDDQLNFSFNVDAEMKILSIYGSGNEQYIKSLFTADPYFKLREMPESNISYNSFGEYSLIVLNGLKDPSSGLASTLRTYLKNGGAVVIFPDLNGNQNLYSSFLTALSLPKIKELKKERSFVDAIDLKNELFKDVFEQVPRNMDLPKVERYFQYESQNRSNRVNILQVPPNQLFFAQYQVDNGKVYLSAASLDPKDSNLSMHPIFVPLMYRIAFSSAGSNKLYYTLGTDGLLESDKIDLRSNESLTLTAKDFEVIPEVRQVPGKSLLYIADQVKNPGFYNLNKPDSLVSTYAFNENREESDMTYASPETLKNLFPGNPAKVFDLKTDKLSSGVTLKNNSTDLWKLCIVLCAVFLGVEILLIRFFNKAKKIQTA
jgi:hypothetical protein